MTLRAEEAHLVEATRWLEERASAGLPRDMIPPTTYVAPGAAMLSLYLTDSRLAYAEGLIGNPRLSKAARGAGLDAVLRRVAEEARAADVRMLCAYIAQPAVERRVLDHGWKVQGRGLSLVTLSLGKDA